jgi:hypothetical protein
MVIFWLFWAYTLYTWLEGELVTKTHLDTVPSTVIVAVFAVPASQVQEMCTRTLLTPLP